MVAIVKDKMAAWRAANDPTLQTDERVREMLRHHEWMIADSKSRYGHSTLGSDRQMMYDAANAAHPWISEARRRGITSSRLYDILSSMSDVSLTTLYRCGKRRARHWFSDPKAMMVLRAVCRDKGLLHE